MNSTPEGSFKSGYVAIIRRPNVGKSTLMNAFLKQKLAIVSPRPQTTRNRILGILHGPDHQVILQDTPGLIEPKYLLQQSMTKAVQASLGDADLALFLIEATGLKEEDKRVLALAKELQIPRLLVVNKIDLVPKDNIIPILADMQATGDFSEVIPVSALEKSNLDRLQALIVAHLPTGFPFYPPDQVADEPERFFVGEIIREQLFLRFSEEIPYSTAVRVEEFKEREDRKDYIRATILVERESQKPIIIGKGGRALKAVGSAARMEIERFLDRPVYLELHISVQKNWRRDAAAIKRLGY